MKENFWLRSTERRQAVRLVLQQDSLITFWWGNYWKNIAGFYLSDRDSYKSNRYIGMIWSAIFPRLHSYHDGISFYNIVLHSTWIFLYSTVQRKAEQLLSLNEWSLTLSAGHTNRGLCHFFLSCKVVDCLIKNLLLLLRKRWQQLKLFFIFQR